MIAETLTIEPEDIILFKFSLDEYSMSEAYRFYCNLKEKFPKHKVLGIPDKTSLETMDLDDLIQIRDQLSKTIERMSGLR